MDNPSKGFFIGKSSDLIDNLKGRVEAIEEMITLLGKEFSIRFNSERIRQVELDIWSSKIDDDEVIIPYDKFYIIPSTEIYNFTDLPQGQLNTPFPDRMYDFSNPKQLFITHQGGMSTKELLDIFEYILPDYGDFSFFEALEYRWDYKEIPVYFLFIGS